MSPFVLVLLFSLAMKTGSADQASFDCKMRQLAMDYAQQIQFWLSTEQVQAMADALNGAQEAQKCNVSARRPTKPYSPPGLIVPTSGTFYVDAKSGSDSNPGSVGHPFLTISRAIEASREDKATHRTIVLREGIFYLTETLELGAKDTNLTIQNYPGESVTISGGRVIKPSWEAMNTENSMNIYKADLSSAGMDSIMGLRVNGKRAIRARYPNADPETQGFGSTLRAQKWLPPAVPPKPDRDENPATPKRNSSDYFQTFELGISGTCANFDPPAGYWCSSTKGPGVYRIPSGLVADTSILPSQPYKNPKGAIIQAWRPGHWASWMFEVGSYEADSGTFVFSKGGFQGARGENNGDEFFIENVMEELDYPNEWFFDTNSKVLYYFHNASSGTAPPDDTLFVVPVLKVLLTVKADQNAYAQSINIYGIRFRDTAYTYMDPHGMPSGGDWALQRTAALFFEGTQFLSVSDCIFERLDGNALMLSGFNDLPTIMRNEFVWIGDSAIASWGDTTGSSVKGMGWDGTQGNQPRKSQIFNNFAHEVGIFEKQSSFYFQAKSCETSLFGNIFFNGPRAGINFNDGFGGGNSLIQNIIFNTCRESGDHGPFNTWDRQVYVTKVSGKLGTEKEFDFITNNFIIANYNSQEAIDNDDGSNYYRTFGNFLAYSGNGFKSDYGGHDNYHHDNIYAYIGQGYTITQGGHDHYFNNNTVVMAKDGVYGSGPCSGDGMIVGHDNKIYSPTGTVTVCEMSLADWQAQGNEKGSTVNTLPSDDDLVKMVKTMLKMN